MSSPKPDCVLFMRYGFRTTSQAGPTNEVLAAEIMRRYGKTPVITGQNMANAFCRLVNAFPPSTYAPLHVATIRGDNDVRRCLRQPPQDGLFVVDVVNSWRPEQSLLKRLLPRDAHADRRSVRHGTVELMAQAVEVARVAGWKHIQPVVLSQQARRVDTIARHLTAWSSGPVGQEGEEFTPTFLPAQGVRAALDPRSAEIWTRNSVSTTLYEHALTTLTARSFSCDSLG